MRLAYFQSLNESDPLPKLGRKVDKTDIIDHEAFERAEAVKAFEGRHELTFSQRHGHKPMPEPVFRNCTHRSVDLDLTKPESWPTVSFADAAEMAEGWIQWGGGECPVSADSHVAVRLRNGRDSGGTHSAGEWVWAHICGQWDIIAYRVIKPAGEVVEATHEKYAAAWEAASHLVFAHGDAQVVGGTEGHAMTTQTKLDKLIKLLKRRWVSPIDALKHCGLMSLSQRVGQLRRRGVHIADTWVKDKNGRNRFKAYKIVTERTVGKGC